MAFVERFENLQYPDFGETIDPPVHIISSGHVTQIVD